MGGATKYNSEDYTLECCPHCDCSECNGTANDEFKTVTNRILHKRNLMRYIRYL